MAKKDERPWKVTGGRPSAEALVRAYLVLLGRPPVIPAKVREEMAREEAEQRSARREAAP